MAEQKIRLGVIGAGWFASRRHLPDARDIKEIEVACLCRRDKDLLKRMAEHFKVSATHTDYQMMLREEPLDAVLICSPHHLHYEHAKAALEKGLHVIMEKPMTLKAEEALDLVALAKSKHLVLLVALNPPYWKHDATAQRLVAQGAVGRLENVTGTWTANAEHVFGLKPMPSQLPGIVPPTLFRADPKLAGGGHFADAGAHLVSEVLWVAQKSPMSVSSLMDNPTQDMRCALNMILGDQVLCGLTNLGNSGLSDKRFRTCFYGNEGTLLIEGPPHRITVQKPREDPLIIEERRMDPVPSPLQDFASCILQGQTPRSSGEHGAQVVAVTEACYESAQTGRTVVLKPPAP